MSRGANILSILQLRSIASRLNIVVTEKSSAADIVELIMTDKGETKQSDLDKQIRMKELDLELEREKTVRAQTLTEIESKQTMQLKAMEHEFHLKELELQCHLQEIEIKNKSIKEPHKNQINSNTQIRMAPLIDIVDPESYFDFFENLAKLNGIERDFWAAQLVPLLQGKAFEAYARLTGSSSSNYTQIKSAILKKFDVSPETLRQKFRTCQKATDETFADFAGRLANCAGRWLAAVDASNNPDKMLDTFLREQFLKQCSYDMRIHIADAKAGCLKEVANCADNYTECRKFAGTSKAQESFEIPMRQLVPPSGAFVRKSNMPNNSAGELPMPTEQKETEINHFKPNRKRSCQRCGRFSHTEEQCWAKTHKLGHSLN